MKSALNDQLYKVFFAITVVTTLVPWVVTDSHLARVVVLACAGVSLLVGLYFYWRSKGHHNAVAATRSMLGRAKGEVEVTLVEHVGQLKELWRLDQKCYGDENISYETLEKWWRSYPRGIFILLMDNAIVGAVGVFPLRDVFFDELLEGKVGEDKITPEQIVPEHEVRTHASWYVSGIVLDRFLRRTRAVATLLYESLRLWREDFEFAGRLRMVSIAYTKQGGNLLRRFRFANYKLGPETVTNHPVYLYETTRLEQFEHDLTHVTQARSVTASARHAPPVPAVAPVGGRGNVPETMRGTISQ